VDFSLGERVTLADYTTLDVWASVPLRRAADGEASRLALFARAANVLDRRYEGVVGFRAPGRTVQVGLRAEF
jgi:outer membrane cobalamin receptor